MRTGSHNRREAITGKEFRARQRQVQMALQLLVFSGVIRRANVEPSSPGAEGAVARPPGEAADTVIADSLS